MSAGMLEVANLLHNDDEGWKIIQSNLPQDNSFDQKSDDIWQAEIKQ